MSRVQEVLMLNEVEPIIPNNNMKFWYYDIENNIWGS